MPTFGLGLWKFKKGKQTVDAVKWAYKCGYRLFDTAQGYGNEADLGVALRDLDIDRQEVFLTSKLKITNFGHEKAIMSIEKSLQNLNFEYFDLFLLHWPVKDLREQSWRALEKIYNDGKVRSIGVSNFTEGHLDELLKYAEIRPVVNQVESHPWLTQESLVDKCNSEKIVFQSYSPLAHGKKIKDKKIRKIGQKYSKSVAQVLLKWGLQRGTCIIVKSKTEKRIKENSDIFDFELSTDDMKLLNSFNRNYHTCWDPTRQE